MPNQKNDAEIAAIKKSTVSGAVSYFLRTIVLQGIGVVAAALLSDYFGPEEFGVYGFVTQIIGILIFFSDIGLAAALVQKKTEPSQAEYRTAFTLQQMLSWLIVLISLILMQTSWVKNTTGTAGVWILLSLALSFPLASLKTISSVILERKLQFSKLIVPQIIEQLVFQFLLLFLAWRGVGVVAYAYAILARAVVGVIAMWLLQPWSLGMLLDRQALKSLLGYGVTFQLNDFLARIKDQLFYLVLGLQLPIGQYGYVQWARNWSMYPYNLTVQNVMAITFPTFSRLQHNSAALAKAIEKSLFFITLTIFPILVGMSVFIFPLVRLLPQYAKWEPAALSLVFFSLSIGLSALSTPLTNTLNAIGQIKTTLKLMVMWTVLTWVVAPVCLYFFGYEGVALSSLLIALTSFIPVGLVQRQVPFQFMDQVWRQGLAAVAMGLVGALGLSQWQSSWSFFILGMLICGLTYVAVMAVTGWKKVLTEVVSLRQA